MRDLTTSFGLNFREYSYHPNKPLLIYLHGAGEKGNTLADLNKLNNVAFVRYFVPAHSDKFTILCPQQITARSNWDGHSTMHGSSFVGWAMENYSNDGRVYVTGHSMGGRGTWDAVCTHKDKITAIAVSAGNSLNYGGVVEVGKLQIPAIHYHGSKDTSIPYSGTSSGQQVCRWYKEGSKREILVTFDGMGHAIDTRVYRDEKLHEWFLKHGTPSIPAPVPAPTPVPEPKEEAIVKQYIIEGEYFIETDGGNRYKLGLTRL